ncbi:hypothetical protein BABINDRAFT_163405 [Babjeviella inositovora NRRL Y-12698]|uniref:Transcription initiation factor IIF subunit beta n=1 Tax=Babjeviella inositovora NRRL Y-12698 TaxID=984486 RepID=A0A1E3QJ13_9ASCO|nr:uncharacterized protein BABINDRAFT_163405 [Babjeviella inositovora NRRL Y-12698]ODQ77696.1 hypothetical protein BABINDRAFT_163405 [Babjeviella inositovora NRRL Y-12698]
MSSPTVLPAKARKVKREEDIDIVHDSDEDFKDLELAIDFDPEDVFDEESLDLDTTLLGQKIWLLRLPRYLSSKWKGNVDKLSGQQIGMVRIKKSLKPNERPRVKLEIDDIKLKELEKEIDAVIDKEKSSYATNTPSTEIPREYDVNILNSKVMNQYVFNEKNLVNYKAEYHAVNPLPVQPDLQPLTAKQQYQKQRFRAWQQRQDEAMLRKTGAVPSIEDDKPMRRYIPFVKTIPKKTKLLGAVVHDCQVMPSRTDARFANINRITKMKIPTVKVRPKVTLLEEVPGITQSNVGPSLRGGHVTTGFLQRKSANTNADGTGRAIRMPKTDLLDLLFRLFEEYEYWSMKGLKERTRQPESYLKESLDSIATLIKKGPYTSKYTLKNEYKKLRDQERAADGDRPVRVPDAEDNEDDDVEMVDIA